MKNYLELEQVIQEIKSFSSFIETLPQFVATCELIRLQTLTNNYLIELLHKQNIKEAKE